MPFPRHETRPELSNTDFTICIPHFLAGGGINLHFALGERADTIKFDLTTNPYRKMLDKTIVNMAIKNMHVGGVAHFIGYVLEVMKLLEKRDSMLSDAKLFLVVTNMSSLGEDTMLLDWKNDFGTYRDMITRAIMYTNLRILGNRFRLDMEIDTMHDVIKTDLFCASIRNESANPTRQQVVV